MVNSNTVNLKFHQFEGGLTVVYFKVSLIQSVILNFVVVQSLKFKCHVIQILCIRIHSINSNEPLTPPTCIPLNVCLLCTEPLIPST